MEECSLDLIFLLGAARPFGFLVGEGLFFPKDEDKVKAFILVTKENLFYIIGTSVYTED